MRTAARVLAQAYADFRVSVFSVGMPLVSFLSLPPFSHSGSLTATMCREGKDIEIKGVISMLNFGCKSHYSGIEVTVSR